MWTTDLKQIHKLFDDAGFEIRIVGGAVRDHLLGLEPNDIDLCTDATPDEMITLAETNSIKVIPTGLQHGTVTFVINGEPYEITTLRIDVETDGRHAEVAFTRSFEEDALRRDFTFNAMSYDIHGVVHDYFDGQVDLKRNVVRFVGDAEARIREDYLRVLRWFRFYSRMGSSERTMEDVDLLRLFGEDWIQSGMDKLSGERIWSELKKILSTTNMRQAAIDLIQTGMLETVLGLSMTQSERDMFVTPSYESYSVIWSIEEILKSDFGHFPQFVELAPITVIARFLASFTPEEANAVIDRLRMSASEAKAMREMRDYMLIELTAGSETARLDLISGLTRTSLTYWVHYASSKGVDMHLALFAALTSPNMFQPRDVSEMIRSVFKPNGEVEMSEIEPFTITGKDLIELGLKPGPMFSKIIEMARWKWYSSSCSMDRGRQRTWVSKLIADAPEPHVLVKHLYSCFQSELDFNKGMDHYDIQLHTIEWATKLPKGFHAVIEDRKSRDDCRMFVLCPTKAAAVTLKLEDEYMHDAK